MGSTDPITFEPECGPCSDFPSDPIFDDVPTSVAGSFSQSPSGGGSLCIIEPQDGSLFPNNWLRPRIRTSGANGATYQITIHADREAKDLVVYTKSNPWYMPEDYWQALTKHVEGLDEQVTITVRASTGGPPVESKTTLKIATVPVGGAIVYWASTTSDPGLTTSALYAFHPGENGVALTLTPAMVKEVVLDDSPQPKRTEYGAPVGQSRCVGCHASTPDGNAVAVTNHWPWNISIVSIAPETAGQQPPYVTPLGSLLAQLPWQGITTFSTYGDNWPLSGASSASRYRYISSFGRRTAEAMTWDSSQPWNAQRIWNNCSNGCGQTNQDDLVWIDLAAPEGATPTPKISVPLDSNVNQQAITVPIMEAMGTSWDIIARDGDSNGAVAPKWSHDGKTIAYTSANVTKDGRVGVASKCDLYTVPFNSGKGGTAKPVQGASDASAAEYYPDYSADDHWLAYNRVANPGGQELYYRLDGELYVVDATGLLGDSPIRLAANDPPACTGETSPGILNTWPKWSPTVREGNGIKYYFLVFSSARQKWGDIKLNNGAVTEPASQLYITAMTWNGEGMPKTYPAIYLWNQQYLVSGSGDKVTATELKTSNVTPAWNEFVLPPVPPVPPDAIK